MNLSFAYNRLTRRACRYVSPAVLWAFAKQKYSLMNFLSQFTQSELSPDILILPLGIERLELRKRLENI